MDVLVDLSASFNSHNSYSKSNNCYTELLCMYDYISILMLICMFIHCANDCECLQWNTLFINSLLIFVLFCVKEHFIISIFLYLLLLVFYVYKKINNHKKLIIFVSGMGGVLLFWTSPNSPACTETKCRDVCE